MCQACESGPAEPHASSPAGFRAAVLTVSTTAFRDAQSDRSGPSLAQILDQHDVFHVTETAIVPDNVLAIQSQISAWCVKGVQLIVTTGGTGFAPDDVTPEVNTRRDMLEMLRKRRP
jgi:gephyrin